MTESVSGGVASPRPSRLLGVLVGWPALLLIWSPAWLLASTAVAWGLVYALAPGRADRWPWWVLGQWLTLIIIFTLAISEMEDIFSFAVVGGATIFALIGVGIWMTPVAIAELHRTQWHTKRPPADDDHPSSTSVETTTLH